MFYTWYNQHALNDDFSYYKQWPRIVTAVAFYQFLVHILHPWSAWFKEAKWSHLCTFLPPATKLGQGYVFTGVCHSVNRGWGCLPQCMLGYTPRADMPPLSRHAPPWADMPPRSRHAPPRADIPPGSRHPPGADMPPWSRPPQQMHPWNQVHPPGLSTHPPRTKYTHGTKYTPPASMLWDTVNARAVRILLECNLVYTYDWWFIELPFQFNVGFLLKILGNLRYMRRRS